MLNYLLLQPINVPRTHRWMEHFNTLLWYLVPATICLSIGPILTVWCFYEPTFRLDLIFKYRMNLFDSVLNMASAIKSLLGEFQAFSIQNNLIGFTSFSWLFVGIKRKSFFNWHNVERLDDHVDASSYATPTHKNVHTHWQPRIIAVLIIKKIIFVKTLELFKK